MENKLKSNCVSQSKTTSGFSVFFVCLTFLVWIGWIVSLIIWSEINYAIGVFAVGLSMCGCGAYLFYKYHEAIEKIKKKEGQEIDEATEE